MMRTFLKLLPAQLACTVGVAAAQHNLPQPTDLIFRDSASESMIAIERLTVNIVLPIVFAVAILVAGLLLYAMVRFNAKANPTPSKVTHNVTLETIWTLGPAIIILFLAIISVPLTYQVSRIPEDPAVTLKAVGNQFYWDYEYKVEGKSDIEFFASMVEIGKESAPELRYLETDNKVVLPVDSYIRVLVTANDVMHAWAVPAFGVKVDAIPHRLGEIWIKATREGTFYGQCSELCGSDHGYMPITIEVVSKEAFDAWYDQQVALSDPLPNNQDRTFVAANQ